MPRLPGDDGRPAPLLALSGVAKSFGAVAALRGVHLELYAGEAHALVGENGAGKSTLVKILAGAHLPDAGTLTLEGHPLLLHRPADARAAGIGVIYQEPTLFPDLSVAENIFMGRQPLGRWRRVDREAMRRRSVELFHRLGVDLDPDRPARGLSIADQQLVEIAKALSFDARLVILDEPTAALGVAQTEQVLALVNRLADRDLGSEQARRAMQTPGVEPAPSSEEQLKKIEDRYWEEFEKNDLANVVVLRVDGLPRQVGEWIPRLVTHAPSIGRVPCRVQRERRSPPIHAELIVRLRAARRPLDHRNISVIKTRPDLTHSSRASHQPGHARKRRHHGIPPVHPRQPALGPARRQSPHPQRLR